MGRVGQQQSWAEIQETLGRFSSFSLLFSTYPAQAVIHKACNSLVVWLNTVDAIDTEGYIFTFSPDLEAQQIEEMYKKRQ